MTISIEKYLLELEPDIDLEEFETEEYQESLFLEYVQKNDKYTLQRNEIYHDYLQKLPIGGEKGLRKRLGAFDLEYFGRAYLPHYFTRKSPDFHRELNDHWTEGVLKGLDPYREGKKINKLSGCRRVTAAPRGHAKSTNLTFKGSIHSICYEYKHFIVLLSDSSDQAEGFISDIKVELEENSIIKEDFGDLKGDKWTDSEFITSTNIKVTAIGSGKKIRGRKHRNWRPDLIILDDVENDENVNTPDQRKKLYNWFTKAVSKAGDTYTDIVYIGTMLHFDSLLAKVLKNPSYKSIKYKAIINFAKNDDLWEMWKTIYTDLDNEAHEQDALIFFEENKEAMLEGTEVLWEEKLCYYDLMVMKISEGDASFNSELQNEPIDPESQMFNEEWFDYYNEADIDFSDPRFIIIGSIDPSLGKTKKSDYSTIIALALDTKTGYMYVIIASIERRKPDVIIIDAIESNKKLKIDYRKGYTKLGVETVQFQQFFKDKLAEESAKCGEYLPVEEMLNYSDKNMRIATLQPDIKNGYIKFNPKHKLLMQQLKEYPMGAHDDGPDDLEMAVRLAKKISKINQGSYQSILKRGLRFKKGAY